MIAWGTVAMVQPMGRPAPLAATWDGASTGAATPVCPPKEAALGAPVQAPGWGPMHQPAVGWVQARGRRYLGSPGQHPCRWEDGCLHAQLLIHWVKRNHQRYPKNRVWWDPRAKWTYRQRETPSHQRQHDERR
jgi:hypothetical protein